MAGHRLPGTDQKREDHSHFEREGGNHNDGGKGRSILWSGMRERAELYVQQLHGYLLLATLEKAC